MLASHVGFIPAAWATLGGLLTDGGGLSSALRIAGLVLSSTFFALKIVDVPWLRLKPGWRSLVSAFVIFSLLHVGVLERSGATDVSSAMRLGAAMCLATVIEADDLRNAVRRIAALRMPVRLLRTGSVFDFRFGRVWEAFPAMPPLPELAPSIAMRAPPLG